MFETVVSVDSSGMLEYWTGPKYEYQFPRTVSWEYKTDTDLYEFAKVWIVHVEFRYFANSNLQLPQLFFIYPNFKLHMKFILLFSFYSTLSIVLYGAVGHWMSGALVSLGDMIWYDMIWLLLQNNICLCSWLLTSSFIMRQCKHILNSLVEIQSKLVESLDLSLKILMFS